MSRSALISTATLLAAMGSSAVQAGDVPKCADRPDLAAPCYQVRGRLMTYNGGAPLDRIWVIGTHRILGIYDRASGDEIMPKAIREQLTQSGAAYPEIFADYEVCPLEKEVAGHQSNVCVESAKHIRVEHHTYADGKDHLQDSKRIPDTEPGTLTDQR